MLIRQATKEDAGICAEILFSTEMGRRYYPSQALLEEEVRRGIEKDRVVLCDCQSGGGKT